MRYGHALLIARLWAKIRHIRCDFKPQSECNERAENPKGRMPDPITTKSLDSIQLLYYICSHFGRLAQLV